jgi:bifunctional UDP-N-acetylglucosamine pyrophosphorylase/glucosamine-1-phosphate N-acetyltransferase
MKAIILAAGKGERLQPLTDFKPKAMLSICNKPLINYQIELLQKHGIDEIAVVVGYLKEKIKLTGVKFYEDRLIQGTASALYAARDFIDTNFILVYGDLFFDILNFSEMIETENSIGIARVKDVSRYGEVVFESGYLKGIREKTGFGEGFVNAGIYHLSSRILDFVEGLEESERKEYELTKSIQMLNEKEQVKVIPLNGYWNDVGYPWEYIDANRYMLERIGFAVGENTEVWDSAIIRKPVLIGEDCKIKNCVVEKSVVGDTCVIGEFSVFKRSVLMSSSKVPHFNYIADSVIAEGCNLGAGTKIANLRFDDANVKMSIKGKRMDSGRRKLGAIIGYNVKTGINVSIYPGVKIRSDTWIEAESLVRKDL